MNAMHYGLKRRVFIYESLCQLPVEIYAGDTATSLARLVRWARHHYRQNSQSDFESNHDGHARKPKLSAIADAPFVQMDSPPDLRRFSNIGMAKNTPTHMMDGVKLSRAVTPLPRRAIISLLAVW